MKLIKILTASLLLLSGLSYAMDTLHLDTATADGSSEEFVFGVIRKLELELDQVGDQEVSSLLDPEHRRNIENLHAARRRLKKIKKSRTEVVEQLQKLRQKRQAEFEQQQRQERALRKLQSLGANVTIELYRG
jgi:dynactin complex subunit